MPKQIFRMSEAGACPRAIAAPHFDYEPIPENKNSLVMLKHATRCENLAVMQINDEGYNVETFDLCPICLETGRKRDGIHVEIDTPLFLLTGHLDGKLILSDKHPPLEIKSLGRFSWPMFEKDEFDAFIGYAGQEACYLKAQDSPGIYWVMNRDNGQALKYIVNDKNNEINLPGFKKITLPVTYEELEDKLNMVVLCIQDNVLPAVEYDRENKECRWCRYRYLCTDEVTVEKESKEVYTPDLAEAAALYKEGHKLTKLGKEKVDAATDTFIRESKFNKLDKFKISGVSVSYRGTRVTNYLDSALMKAEIPDLHEKYLRHSKPWDDISIRILKGG